MKKLLVIILVIISNFCFAQKPARGLPDLTEEEVKAYDAKHKIMVQENAAKRQRQKEDYLRKKQLTDEENQRRYDKEDAEAAEAFSKTITLTPVGDNNYAEKEIEYHLSPEEIRQGRAMTNYRNSVEKFKSSGLSSSQANDFARRESNMNVQEEIINKAFEGIGQMIISGMDRKEEKVAAQDREVYNFRKGVEQASKDLRKSNNAYEEHVDNALSKSNSNTKNVPALKKNVLMYLEAYRDYMFSHRIDDRFHKTNYGKDILLVQQTINKAFFKGNVLHIDYNQKVKMAQYDKDDERYYSKNTWQPAKFDVHTLVEYNIATGKSKIMRRGVWGGNKVLPASGYLSADDFWNKTDQLSKRYYARPNRSNKNVGVIIPGYGLKSALNNLSTALAEKQRAEALLNEEYMAQYQINLEYDVKMYKESYWGPLLFTKHRHNSTNRNETSILCLFDDRYILFSFPEKEKLRILDHKNISSLRDNAPFNTLHIKSEINGLVHNFRQSQHNDNIAIGGGSGEDLLVTGEQATQFEEELYSYYYQNNFVKELNFYAEQDRDIWNPYVEIGTIQKTVDKDFIKDKAIVDYLDKQGFRATRESLPQGLGYKLIPKKSILILPFEKFTYTYQGNVKGKYQINGKNTSSNFLHFKPSSRETGEAVLPYKNSGEEDILNNILRYEPLNDLTSTMWFNHTFYNAIYKFITERPEKKIRRYIDTKGTVDMMNTMIDYLSEISFSEYALNHEGRIKQFNASGKLESIGKNIGGEKHGFWEYFNEEGKLIKSCSYRQGVNRDTLKTYDDLGRLSTLKVYNYGDSYTFAYNDDGYKFEYTHNTDGIKHGPHNIYRPDGRLFRTEIYEEGLLLRDVRFYYEKGILLGKSKLINGKLNGHTTFYHKNGKLEEEGEYMNGKKQGSWKVYDKNGNYLQTEEYINDKKQ